MQITENTKVDIKIVIVVVAVVTWAIRLEGRVNYATDILTVVRSLDSRTSRIEGALGIKAPEDGDGLFGDHR